MITRGRLNGIVRQNESALRHKVRNLRAKVRLLLPMQMCCKQQKRTKNLFKLVQSKTFQDQQRKKRWCHVKQHSVQLFIPHETQKSQKHLFHKLTNEQIEQIKQDKMYYLGEDFIEQFNNFVQMKQKAVASKQPNTMKNTVIQKSCVQSIQNLPERHPQLCKTISSEFADFIQIQKQNKLDWQIKHNAQLLKMRQKKKIMTEEDISKATINKTKLKQKQQKIQINYELLNIAKIESIRQRNKLNDYRTSQSIRNKHTIRQIGQINELSEKLREICLLRNSKSANLLYRY